MSPSNRGVIRVVGLSLALPLSIAPVTELDAQGIAPCTHEARFGLVGLAKLQLARLNVVNVLPPDPTLPPDPVHPPDPEFPPGPCHVGMGFLDSADKPFLNAAGAPILVELDLEPGQSSFIELNWLDAFRNRPGSRVPFRATALLTHLEQPPPDDGSELPPDACSALVPTLELVETLTSRSQVVMDPLEIFGFNPQPEPPISFDRVRVE